MSSGGADRADPRTGPGRGHTAATLFEAAVAAAGPGRYAMDPGMSAAWPGARLAGPAFTVQGAGGDNLALQHAILEAPAGSVLVADVNGAPWGHWGEVLAVADIAGLVIDGGVRDTVEMGQLGFPVFSSHVNVRGTRKLFRGALGVPVQVGEVTVHPGDLVVGDADGVVVLPRKIAERVVRTADGRLAKEADIMRRLHAGETTLDIYGLREAGRG